MLHEYFSLEISPAGDLITLPLLVKGYTPPMSKLPRFLLSLGPKVNWKEEQPCFETFLKELAKWYVPESLPAVPGGQGAPEEVIPDELRKRRQHVRYAVEHIFFPAFKARLVATNGLMENGGVLECADLKGLYRVFERC